MNKWKYLIIVNEARASVHMSMRHGHLYICHLKRGCQYNICHLEHGREPKQHHDTLLIIMFTVLFSRSLAAIVQVAL